MPSVTSKAALRKISQSKKPENPLRPVSPEELESWSDRDGDSESTLSEPLPEDLDEPWPYTFHTGQAVWIRTSGGNWHSGRVSSETTRKGNTREKEGLFYPVKFDGKLRKYFAPLNGEIKPDTPHTRRLLKGAGWL
ncbi:hypothetical protein DFJ43DRAFT_43877 [Lentinula guzmanii]|uniref:Uncharacterized protein n=2 Tax=Lentinula TaxID=5352 RepID=A0AA38JSR7_9AGAR|nr:hypothetical protein DFJ43DRAFT_43877 [Lentinula guzmanii]KAJ3785408.1 hypothetical protein GGU10DRAFT_4378 [Lentinula aff. detonsa]